MVLLPRLACKWRRSLKPSMGFRTREFRSKAALETLIRVSEDKIPNLVLYNYPSFSGAFAALFAHLYHSQLGLPFVILPYSKVEPFREEDLVIEGVKICYLLDFVGPKGFAVNLSQSIHQVVLFDHRKSALEKVPDVGNCPNNLMLHININRSSTTTAYDYFTEKLNSCKSPDQHVRLVNDKDEARLAMLLKYIEEAALHRYELPGSNAFNIGLTSKHSKLNCITNPYIFDQLLEMDSTNLITKGNAYLRSRQDAANKLLGKAFKIRLGKGFYGECLGIRADGNSDLSNEIGKELSIRSAAAGLRNPCGDNRPIGAVVYVQRGNLKMCLRSTDSATDTSEVAKAYGGGGCFGSSSFIIRMDEYNQWVS